MKKKLVALLAIFTVACSLAACSFSMPDDNSASNTVSGTESTDTTLPEISDTDSSNTSGGEQDQHLCTAFTPTEKNTFSEQVGFVIPFAPSDEYYVEDYFKENPGAAVDEFSVYINYYTFGNTQAEFNAYKALYSTANGYTFVEEYEDDYGDTCYVYSKGGAYVDISFYEYDGEMVIDVYVYVETNGSGGNGGSTDVSEAESILTLLYSLNDGEYVEGPFTLTGTIIEIDSYTNPTIVVEGFEDMPVYCYRLKVSNQVGDVITVTAGKMTNYGGLYEFMDCTLVSSQGGNQGGGFTATESALFNEYFGFVIPFAPSDEYFVEDYSDYYPEYYEAIVCYYTFGNTQAEFNAYKALYSTANGYTFVEEYEDDYGDTCYVYSKGDVYVEMSYYTYDGDDVIDVYVYIEATGSGGNQGGGSAATDFTAEEKALFEDSFGFVVPFVESSEYYVEEYTYYYEETDETEVGVNFYAYGLTQAEFNAYKALFTTANGYTYDGAEEDSYGDMWYYYTKNDHYVDVTYYADDYGDYLIDVYVYDLYEGDLTGGSGGNNGNQGGTPEDVDLITNAGKGLPSDTDGDGVHNVDFTDATYVKNVTEQGYYLDGCPTTGSPKVLVVPVEFSDCTAKSKGYTIDKIKAAFEKGGKTDYFSVYDYYYQSSYGALSLDITVLDEWFMPSKTSSYYKTATIDYYGDQVEAGEQLIMDELLAYLAGKIDLSQFDSDGNTVIDAIVFVNTLDIDSDSTFNWAFRYWNIYTDDEGYYYEYDGVSANDYLWASYQFLYETYDEEGYSIYDESVMNTYTFIHEFGHVLGADDYYDTSYNTEESPTASADVMDGMLGDHNAYTKFNYGWLTTSRLVNTESSVTLTLEAFYKNGDTIIIANNWDDDLGAYQEYYIIAYYKSVELNDEALNAHYFARDGVVVYHVNASLYAEVYDGETYYDVYNNNTDASDEYGTYDNLIEYVKSANDTFTYIEGDTLPKNVTDDNGNTLAYNFVVDSIDGDVVTITFTKK